ncbi:MAG: hypothetical protein H0W50_08485 [Parachlamydiaceae bacterium]|nr:hypothetical protein [Parachlamydiaceae bacterium]
MLSIQNIDTRADNDNFISELTSENMDITQFNKDKNTSRLFHAVATNVILTSNQFYIRSNRGETIATVLNSADKKITSQENRNFKIFDNVQIHNLRKFKSKL